MVYLVGEKFGLVVLEFFWVFGFWLVKVEYVEICRGGLLGFL